MYIPKYFQMKEEQEMYRFMKEYSFATLVSQSSNGLVASHLPLMLKADERVLYGHFAKANSQWKELDGQQVLVIFQGPHSYISSSWYETKDAVPTWNYTAVHVNGTLQLLQDEALIDECLRDLIKKYEAPDSSYQYDEVDSNYIASLKKGIVAFKIDIEKIEGKAKLSQNHSSERQQLVIEQLKNTDDTQSIAIAKLMEQNKN